MYIKIGLIFRLIFCLTNKEFDNLRQSSEHLILARKITIKNAIIFGKQVFVVKDIFSTRV